MVLDMRHETTTSGQYIWPKVIEKVNKSGRYVAIMGSANSAQVTRCRLLSEYDGLQGPYQGLLDHSGACLG